ncbi:hypothetical protein M413DRAFT_359282 [Hebeloma cylindrosporum]|uniref:Uncharacterized protein n=1 Tax=Hebeloma cylindrosporum TaxID=76867 RepID=A0A0C3C746_HEBCY|nr:hypothetical protein M413DRAFT_359282 [Hebeloma cylindrosporum h7]
MISDQSITTHHFYAPFWITIWLPAPTCTYTRTQALGLRYHAFIRRKTSRRLKATRL